MYRVLSMLLVTMILSPAIGAAEDAKAGKDEVLQKIVVIGASASSGYGTGSAIEPGFADITLAEILDGMLQKKHTPVLNTASHIFFNNPKEVAGKMIEKAGAAQPTAVVALDFLFWFGYGKFPGIEDRMKSLEEGLKMLEGFSCPLLVGLIPDMRQTSGFMIMAEQIPDAASLKALNGRIQEWIKSRKNALLVPWIDIIEKAKQNKEVAIGPNRWGKGTMDKLLQKDKLHPTADGLGAMAALTFEALIKSRRDLPKGCIQLNLASVLKKLVDAKRKEWEDSQKKKK